MSSQMLARYTRPNTAARIKATAAACCSFFCMVSNRLFKGLAQIETQASGKGEAKPENYFCLGSVDAFRVRPYILIMYPSGAALLPEVIQWQRENSHGKR